MVRQLCLLLRQMFQVHQSYSADIRFDRFLLVTFEESVKSYDHEKIFSMNWKQYYMTEVRIAFQDAPIVPVAIRRELLWYFSNYNWTWKKPYHQEIIVRHLCTQESFRRLRDAALLAATRACGDKKVSLPFNVNINIFRDHMNPSFSRKLKISLFCMKSGVPVFWQKDGVMWSQSTFHQKYIAERAF